MNPGGKTTSSGPVPRLALAILIVIGAATTIGPFFLPYSMDQQDPRALLQAPGRVHWMGTDRLGRDLLARVLAGGRLSLALGVVTALAALSIGTVYGAVSGYVGGKTDRWMMRLVDVIYSLPDLLLIILITLVIGRGPPAIFLALTLVSWVTVARIVRGEVLGLKRSEYVEAARALGAGSARILALHIVPAIAGPLLVTVTYRIPAAILAESTLSFVGLGIPPPFASWGALANDGWTAMRFYPHLLLFPSLLIILVILALTLVGDSLSERFNPRALGG